MIAKPIGICSIRFLCGFVLCCLAEYTMATSQEHEPNGQEVSLIENGDFEQWQDGHPAGWQVQPGIFNGDQSPVSKVAKATGPALKLSGSKNTLAWNIVSQSFPLTAGKTYELKFVAKAEKLKRESNQFDNCHIGLWFKDRQKRVIGRELRSVESKTFQLQSIVATIPQGAVTTDVAIVLSKSGSLIVRKVELNEVAAEQVLSPFDALIRELKTKYSYHETKQISFDQMATKYRELAEQTESTDEFVDVIADMLAELKDNHVWIINNGRRFTKHSSSFVPNYNFQFIDQQLSDVTNFGRVGLLGRTNDGFGYLRITSLENISLDEIRRIQTAMKSLFDGPGFIVDLRRNSGGDETTAQKIAGLFADKSYIYAKHRFREGEGFGDITDRVLHPVEKGNCFERQVICLSGPGAVSSGEAFVLMMKAIDHCTIVGRPTRGSSGNPAPVTLPNGVQVWFSRWVAMEADGSIIEDRGVLPDVDIQHPRRSKSDPAFEYAVKLLNSSSPEK